MKTIVIKSNHGNHTGFNRKWEVLNSGYPFDSKEEAIKYLDAIIDECEDDIPEEERTEKGGTGYEYDLYYYNVVTQEDYENDFFSGGHYGYTNRAIKEIFETENEEA